MKEFSTEQKILLNLLARSLGSESRLPEEVLSACNFRELMKESSIQAVILQAFDALSVYKEHVPDDVYASWRRSAMAILARNQQVAAEQHALTELLERSGYDYVIIKGSCAAFYYLKPEMRTLGDVDFLIEPSKTEEIGALLLENGASDPNDRSYYHITYERNGIHLELHYALPGVPPEREVGDFLRAHFRDLEKRGTEYDVYDGRFSGPPAAEHGAIILLHMVHHLLGLGLGLRHLCDWAAFVQSTHTMPFWQESLLPLFREVGLYDYAMVMTQVCARYLEIECPAWAEEASDELCAAMMNDFFESGNFGEKDTVRKKSADMLGEQRRTGVKRGKFRYLLHNAYKSTVKLYPIVKKAPILYPFILVWRVVRYLWNRMLGKRVAISKTLDVAESRQKLYDRLKIYEVEDD